MELITLQTIWFLLIVVLFIVYAILDGFDLGVGILHFFAKNENERRISMNSVGPYWDGNEVWLIAAGGALFAAFSPVYAAIWSGFYVAILLLLVALIARAVSFDYRAKVETEKTKRLLDYCFGGGSLLIALLLGVAFGNILRGIPIDARGEYVGTFWGLLNPFAIAVGLLTSSLFMLHGALWLLVKTEGDLHARVYKQTQRLWVLLVVLYVLTTFYAFFEAPHLFEGVTKNWLWWICLITALASIALIPLFLSKRKQFFAFLSSSVLIAALIGASAVGLFPNFVPSTLDPAYSLTAFNQSNSRYTLQVMFWIAISGVPLAIVYKIIIYRVFRGKTVLTKDSY